jgi:LPPG:FO 2-phospho-L-lactate transferase
VKAKILPMSDQPVRTTIKSEELTLGFQEYFVARRCVPKVTGISFQGVDGATAGAGVLQAIASPVTGAIVICPSNPYLSIDPLLALPGLRSAIAAAPVPVIAVTPIIGGRAVRGPAAKIMAELGLPVSPTTVAHHYAGLIDGFVLDQTDVELKEEIGVPVCLTNTLMRNLDDKVALARAVCAFAVELEAGLHRSRTES